MPGRGPAPKDPERRARRNEGPTPLRIVHTEKIDQPSLSELLGDENPLTKQEWSKSTVMLWEELGTFPSTEMLQWPQWALLSRAMMLDDAVVRGDAKYASEARLQMQKFGIAPDDVARLRIVFAQADIMDPESKKATGQSAKDRRANVKVVRPPEQIDDFE
jgi:hypothetical protein